MTAPFSFELVSPEKLLLSGEATEVLVPGSDGYFTVMANHAPVMSTIKPGIVEVKMSEGAAEKIFVRGGFADVSPAGCTLLAEYAVPMADLNLEEIENQIKDAREDVADADTDEKREKAQAMLDQLEEVRAIL